MKNPLAIIAVFVAAVGLVAAVLAGYILNIVKLFRIEHFDGHIGEVIIRIIGILTGFVGVIAGYF